MGGQNLSFLAPRFLTTLLSLKRIVSEPLTRLPRYHSFSYFSSDERLRRENRRFGEAYERISAAVAVTDSKAHARNPTRYVPDLPGNESTHTLKACSLAQDFSRVLYSCSIHHHKKRFRWPREERDQERHEGYRQVQNCMRKWQ